MTTLEHLKDRYTDATAERDALVREEREIGRKIEQAIRDNARAKLDGTKPAAPRNTVAKLRERRDELPIYIEAANQRVHETELALIGAEMKVSQERSKELGAELQAARKELEDVTKRVKALEGATHAEGTRYFRLMEKQGEVQRELAEALQGTEPEPVAAQQPVRW